MRPDGPARRPLRVVRFIVHRPRAMLCLSMGSAIAMIVIFVIGIIFRFIPFEIDYSTGQLNVEGDEIADRHRAVEAAQRQSSRYGPGELAMRLLPLCCSAYHPKGSESMFPCVVEEVAAEE